MTEDVTKKPLKHAGYEVGDHIRAYDFEPRDGVPERFVEGRIESVHHEGIETEETNAPFGLYVVKVTRDTTAERTTVLVPMEVYPFEYGGRVQKIEAPTEPEQQG